MPDGSLRVAVIGATHAAELERVLARLPPRANMAVLAHCTGPDLAARQLSAPMRAVDLAANAAIEPSTIYLIPAHRQVEIRDRALVVTGNDGAHDTLDVLLRAIADQFGMQSVGVLLSGAGTNGVTSIRRIKEVGGITIAQAGLAGDAAEMSRAAIASGAIDLVLPLPEIAARLESLAVAATQQPDDRGTDTAGDTLRDILSLVRVRLGHDFAAYKRATLFRRVSRRMQVCQVDTIVAYHQYLREHPDELQHLLRDFLIGVTSFLRDREAFEAVARAVVPAMFAGKQAGDQVRAWVVGCATGEEAYSLAILLAEHAAKHGAPQPVQVFATDIDEASLAEARQGRYPASIAVDVGAERLERFFMRENGDYRVCKEVRDMVMFSPHNVLRDPPFSRLDLISCRNLLIYLNREAQDRVINLFHFGLRPDGHLFLGASETVDNSSLFGSVDPKVRLFRRRPADVGQRLDVLAASGSWQVEAASAATPPSVPPRSSSLGDLHFRIVERYAPPSVLVNSELDIVHVSEHAGRFLEIRGGEPTKQLLQLVIAPLRLDVRTAIHAARQRGHGSETRLVRFEDADGRPRTVEIRAIASNLDDTSPAPLLVMFDEKAPGDAAASVPTSQRDARTMEPVVRELEDELQRTRDQLRTTIEQYESSVEELEASNEELQAINEELRSATEELESNKEELQSVNQELTALNHELEVKVEEITRANSDLQNLMSSTDIGVLFLDRKLHIQRFTPRAQDLFNVIPADLGRPLAHLTHRLVANDLAEQAQAVLQTLRTVESAVTSTDGRRYLMRLSPYRSLDDRIEGVVATFVDTTDLHDAREERRESEAALHTSEERLRLTLGAIPMVVLTMSREGKATWGYALGNEVHEADVGRLFAPDHGHRFAAIVTSVLAARRPQRAELDIVVDGAARTYEFRFEPTAHGVDAVGFAVSAGPRDRA